MASLTPQFHKVTRKNNPDLTRVKREVGKKRSSLPLVQDKINLQTPTKALKTDEGRRHSLAAAPCQGSNKDKLKAILAKRKARKSGVTAQQSSLINNFFSSIPKTSFPVSPPKQTDAHEKAVEENDFQAIKEISAANLIEAADILASDVDENDDKENAVATPAKTPLKDLKHINQRQIKPLKMTTLKALIGKPVTKELPAKPATWLRSANSVAPDAPAYQKYQSLVDSSNINELKLPIKYQSLQKMFIGLEAIICFQLTRGQIHTITYHHVKKAVENYCDTEFSIFNLGQLLKIYTKAFKCEPISAKFLGGRVRTYQLFWGDREMDGMSSVELTVASQERVDLFNKNLLAVVVENHNKYLKSIGLGCVELKDLASWHPNFDLENVPDVESAKLPTLAEPEAAKNVIGEEVKKSGKIVLPDTPEIKKLSVLERVRLKQKLKIQRDREALPVATVKKLAQMSRLPDVVDRLDLIYASCKKTALYKNDLVKKFLASIQTPLSSDEFLESLSVLTETVPEWCFEHASEFGVLVKIDRSVHMSDVFRTIEAKKHQVQFSEISQ